MGQNDQAVTAPVDVLAELRASRDKAQAYWAHVRKSCNAGQAWANREVDSARSAYLLAQSEYRAARIAALARNGGAL